MICWERIGEDVLLELKSIQNRTEPTRHGFKKWSILFLICLLAVSCPTFVYADKKNNENEVGQIETIDLSLYDVQTALSAYVNNVVGVNGNDKHANNRVEATGKNNIMGNAGAYVGYGDIDAGFSSYIMSNLTHGVSSSTYDAWQEITDTNENEVYAYTRFGRLLADTGLDETDSVGNANGRWMTGGLLVLLYAMSECIPMMFGFALKLLQLFNPFAFLSNTASWTGYWKAAFPTAHSSLTNVVYAVSHWFDIIVNKLTWAVTVPMLVCLLCVNVLLLRKKAGSAIANFIKRITFFAIGIPICAGLYTNVVNSLYEVTAKATTSSQLVVSTVVDFESWVTHSQLAVPNEALLESIPKEKDTDSDMVNGGAASEETLHRLRHTAQAINHDNNEQLGNIPLLDALDYDHGMLSGNIWNKDVESVSSTEGSEAFQGLNELVLDMKTKRAVLELLERYGKGSFYRATDFETTYMNELTTKYRTDVGHMGSSHGATSNNGTVYEMFDRTNDVQDWFERDVDFNAQIWSPPSQEQNAKFHMKWTLKPWNVFCGGKLKVSSMNPKDIMKFTTDGDYGLSRMSMYNYLSTAFDENSLMVYSNDKSVSENSRQQHYAANIIGTGALQLAFTANLMVILAVLVIIAFVFSFKIAMQNMKRGFQLLCSIPTAMMGVVKSISQVISYVIAMIMELIVSMFLYLFVSDLLILVAIVVETLVTGDSGGTTVTVLMTLGGQGLSAMEGNLTCALFLESAAVLGLCGISCYYRQVWYRIRTCASRRWYQLFTCTEMMSYYEQVIQNGTAIREREQEPITWKEWIGRLQSDLGFAH